MATETHTVPVLKGRVRISDYAVDIFRSIPTKSGIKKALKKGEIKIGDKLAKSGDWLLGGEVITLEKELKINPYDLDIKVVYEDDHLAVIIKPAGIPVHSHTHRNIQNALPTNLKQSKIPHAMSIARPVHRLDYETSGLLIVAKTYEAMTKLAEALASRHIKKTYTAVVIGVLPEKGTLTTSLDNKDCRTDYVIKDSVLSEKYGKLNLIEINLLTGRKNQIRRHFQVNGNPILGDKKYFIESMVSFGNGLYLTANALSFLHPISKHQVNLSIPLSKKFIRLFPSGA